MIERRDTDVLIFGEENVRELHTELLLKCLITSDDDEYEIYKEEENSTGCRVIFSTKLEKYGTIGILWFYIKRKRFTA